MIGVMVYFMPFLIYPYFAFIITYGTVKIFQNKDNGFTVLCFVMYVMALEVLFRMKSGGTLYDLGKYTVVYFSFLGIFINGIKAKTAPYFIALLLLIPGIYLTITTFYFEIDVRKKIMFNLLGEFALIFVSIFFYNREIYFNQIKKAFFYALGPILCILINVILFSPVDLRETIHSTNSNFDTSGGFGPNQMSVILGLGAFLTYFSLIFEESKSKLLRFILGVFFIVLVYRSLLTFSRGGTITFLLVFVVFNAFVFYKFNKTARLKISFVLLLATVMGFGIWSYSLFQTNGFIELRYKNQDARGRIKESVLTGREYIIAQELELFKQNPVFGVGPGLGAEYRSRDTDSMEGVQAHSEITRLLAEHGVFGLVFLLILIFTPLIRFWNNKNYIHILLIPFLIFWGLTINHAATRIVAPSVIYALTLLNIKINNEKEDTLHRESV